MIRYEQIGAAALVALLVLSVMTMFAASVVAQEEQEDEGPEITLPEDNEVEGPEITLPEDNEVEELEVPEIEEERELEVKVDEDEVEIEARNRSEVDPQETEDVFKLKISTEEGAKFKLEFTDKFEREDNIEVEREIELEFEAKFDAIVEFVDNDGDGLYDEGEEVYVYDLEETQFAPIQYTIENVGNTSVHKITVQTVDGVFTAILYSSGNPVIVSGENVKPNEVKITIEIDNFPYTREDSKLALKTEFKSEIEVEEEKHGVEGEDEDEVEVTYGDYAGFFSWKQTALVDGFERAVKSTSLEDDPDEDDRELYLIYERGNKIVHDPKIGVSGAVGAVAAISWATVIVSAIVAALVSIGVTGIMLRKKGR